MDFSIIVFVQGYLVHHHWMVLWGRRDKPSWFQQICRESAESPKEASKINKISTLFFVIFCAHTNAKCKRWKSFHKFRKLAKFLSQPSQVGRFAGFIGGLPTLAFSIIILVISASLFKNLCTKTSSNFYISVWFWGEFQPFIQKNCVICWKMSIPK